MASVAVIGAGVQGLAAIKNFVEEGFQVTCYEKRPTLGGIWQYTEDENLTSVLPTTLGNVSKYRNRFTDFPIGPEEPVHMNTQQFLEYIHRYASHFALEKHVSLRTEVRAIERLERQECWALTLEKDGNIFHQKFDKIALCSGKALTAFRPPVEGESESNIQILHSQSYKRPEDFKNKKVLILGLGSTAADVACELVGTAEKVWLSHRHGVSIFARWVQGKPLDIFSNRRMAAIRDMITYLAPAYSRKMFSNMARKMAAGCFEIDPSWGLEPAPLILNSRPLISDELIDRIRDGSILSVSGVKALRRQNAIELLDGTILENVDTVIFCTGYRSNFDLFADNVLDFGSIAGVSIPRLYYKIFSPRYADSIAFLNNYQLGDGICAVADLSTIAVAQIWKGTYSLPSESELNLAVDRQIDWLRTIEAESRAATGVGGIYAETTNAPEWIYWLNEAAGTGVNEFLGYGIKGWTFYLTDPTWCSELMAQHDSPHVLRLFPGRRKRWEGAMEAIKAAHIDVQQKLKECGQTKETQKLLEQEKKSR